MNTKLHSSLALLAGAAVLLVASNAEARPVYGVSGSHGAAVRGTRGAVAVGDDRTVAVTRRGVAATGPNATVVARRR